MTRNNAHRRLNITSLVYLLKKSYTVTLWKRDYLFY